MQTTLKEVPFGSEYQPDLGLFFGEVPISFYKGSNFVFLRYGFIQTICQTPLEQ